MASNTAPEVASLKADIARLQSDLNAAAAKIRGLSGDEVNGHDSAIAQAERAWGRSSGRRNRSAKGSRSVRWFPP